MAPEGLNKPLTFPISHHSVHVLITFLKLTSAPYNPPASPLNVLAYCVLASGPFLTSSIFTLWFKCQNNLSSLWPSSSKRPLMVVSPACHCWKYTHDFSGSRGLFLPEATGVLASAGRAAMHSGVCTRALMCTFCITLGAQQQKDPVIGCMGIFMRLTPSVTLQTCDGDLEKWIIVEKKWHAIMGFFFWHDRGGGGGRRKQNVWLCLKNSWQQ